MTQTAALNAQPDRPPLLTLDAVTCRFCSQTGQSVEALGGIDLSIPAESFVTFVGASGSGKTTLLNCVAGILAPTSGTIRYAPQLNLKTDLAYVFQHYTLLPWRTIFKNVTFGLELRGVGRTERHRVARFWLDRVDLADFAGAYPHELSGGMRQRAAIAQALAIGPKLLLMDEPFGSLDDAIRADLQRMLVDLQAESRTTIMFVTHNIDEAIVLADRVIVLSPSPGRVIDQVDVPGKTARNRTDRQFTELFLKIRNLINRPQDQNSQTNTGRSREGRELNIAGPKLPATKENAND